MPEEIKKEEIKQPEGTINTPDNGKDKKPEIPPSTDFKIAEIWIRNGQLMLDATPEFWRDKFRARGVIAYLDDIVKDAKVPQDKPRITPVKGSFLNGIRNFMGRKR
jgi:hypothetical protein